MFRETRIATALTLALSPAVANACGADHPSSYKPPKPKYDLIVEGSWHYLNDHDVEIDVARTLHGPRLLRLEIKGEALGKDEIIVTCGPGPWRFTRYRYPDGQSYPGRFFLLKSPDGTYQVHHWVDPNDEAAE